MFRFVTTLFSNVASSDAKLLRRVANDCANLEQNHPIVRSDVVWMNGDEVTRNSSANETHCAKPVEFTL